MLCSKECAYADALHIWHSLLIIRWVKESKLLEASTTLLDLVMPIVAILEGPTLACQDGDSSRTPSFFPLPDHQDTAIGTHSLSSDRTKDPSYWR